MMANSKGTFEEQLAELEKVVDKLERGDLTLEENVSLFERGVALSNACKKQLASAESRIQVLLDPKDTGPVRTAELDVDTDDEVEADEDEE
jgi:exodeoxyribonuclease VII small subunit